MRAWIDRTDDGLSGMPADGTSAAAKLTGISACPADSSQLGYIMFAHERKGAVTGPTTRKCRQVCLSRANRKTLLSLSLTGLTNLSSITSIQIVGRTAISMLS
jgi:hypothetical protein